MLLPCCFRINSQLFLDLLLHAHVCEALLVQVKVAVLGRRLILVAETYLVQHPFGAVDRPFQFNHVEIHDLDARRYPDAGVLNPKIVSLIFSQTHGVEDGPSDAQALSGNVRTFLRLPHA